YRRVYLAKKKSTGDHYAVKVISKRHMKSKADVERILLERNILAMVDNPFIVKLFYSFQTFDQLYMVMEYLNGGDLLSLLESAGHFGESWAQFYTAELVLAVEHLHSLGIVHRDIKPQNLLIDKRGHLKLADFGLSRMHNASSGLIMPKTNSFVGTPEYLAPEMLLGSGYDESVDWWDVGIILYEILVGNNPFYDDDVEKTFENILSRKFTWPKGVSSSAMDILDGLLTVEPSDRLGYNGAGEIKKHSFYNGIDWDNISNVQASFIPILEGNDDTRYF
ncbi:serine/threonine protein kinase 15, partial [Rozella allomycis CSF55]